MRKEPAFPLSGSFLTTECKGLSVEDWFLGQCLAGGSSLEGSKLYVELIMEERRSEAEYTKVKKDALVAVHRAWEALSRSRACHPMGEQEMRVVAQMEDAVEALK